MRGGDEKTTRGSEQLCREREAWHGRRTSVGLPHLELGIALLSMLTVTAYVVQSLVEYRSLCWKLDLREKYVYLEGSYNSSWYQKGQGPQLVAGESQLRRKENTSRRWVAQHWSRSWDILEVQPGLTSHLLSVTVLLWRSDWTEWLSEVLPNQDSCGINGCVKTWLLCEICASKSKESSVKCWRKETRIWWLKSFVLGQEPSIISLAEAAHQLIRGKGYPLLGGSGTKPMFLSPPA